MWIHFNNNKYSSKFCVRTIEFKKYFSKILKITNSGLYRNQKKLFLNLQKYPLDQKIFVETPDIKKVKIPNLKKIYIFYSWEVIFFKNSGNFYFLCLKIIIQKYSWQFLVLIIDLEWYFWKIQKFMKKMIKYLWTFLTRIFVILFPY